MNCKLDCSIRVSQSFAKFLCKKFLNNFCIQNSFYSENKAMHNFCAYLSATKS